MDAADLRRPVCAVRGSSRLAGDYRSVVQIASAVEATTDHAARRRRYSDRAERRCGRCAGEDKAAAAARRTCVSLDRGPQFLQPLGGRSARNRPRRVGQSDQQPHPGRQHDHPAARQVHLPHPRAQPDAKAARGADRVLAGGVADQGRDPRTVSVERLFRRQPLWASGGLDALLLPPPGKAHRLASRDAGGADAGAQPLCSDQKLRAGPKADAYRGRGDGRGGCADPDGGQGGDPASARRPRPRCIAHRNLLRRLGAARGARPGRGRLCAPDADHHARHPVPERRARRDQSCGIGRRASRTGGDASQWRSRRDDRRARLRQIAVQPGHPGAPPAGIDLQAVRLSRRPARWTEPRQHDRQHRDHGRIVSPAQCRRSVFADDRAGRCVRPVKQRRSGPPVRQSRRYRGDPGCARSGGKLSARAG